MIHLLAKYNQKDRKLEIVHKGATIICVFPNGEIEIVHPEHSGHKHTEREVAVIVRCPRTECTRGKWGTGDAAEDAGVAHNTFTIVGMRG